MGSVHLADLAASHLLGAHVTGIVSCLGMFQTLVWPVFVILDLAIMAFQASKVYMHKHLRVGFLVF